MLPLSSPMSAARGSPIARFAWQINYTRFYREVKLPSALTSNERPSLLTREAGKALGISANPLEDAETR